MPQRRHQKFKTHCLSRLCNCIQTRKPPGVDSYDRGMPVSFDRKYLVALAIALLCFGGLVALGMRTTTQLRDNEEAADRARDLQVQVKDVYATLLDLEAGQRGYLLTPKPSYLDPYRSALARLDDELGPLSAMAATHPDQAVELATLRSLIDDKRAELARTIEVADAQGVETARAVVASDEGKATMDAIRTLIANLQRDESRDLMQLEAAEAASIEASTRFAAVLVALMAGLLCAIYVLIRREDALRQRAHQAEVDAMRVLERRLEERTAELEQASRALDLSEARLRGIFDSATDSILTADETHTIVMANPAAARTFRRAMDELLGVPLEQLIPERFRREQGRDEPGSGVFEVSANHVGLLPDATGLRADGEEFPIDAAVSHLNVGDQQLYTVILRDITERRRAETALLDSEARLRRLLALLPEAVVVFSSGRISFVNDAAQRLLGADEAALLGRPWLEFIHPDSVELVQSRILALEGGAAVVPLIEEKILRADGSTRSVEATSTLIQDHDAVSMLSVVRDVTELRQVQSELVRSHSDLRRLVAAQDKVQEDERKRIARELHDDLQQRLAAIKLDLFAIGQRLTDDPEGVAHLLAEVDDLASAAIDSTRRIVSDLRPQILEDLGLAPALESLIGQFSKRTGIACQLEVQDEAAGEQALHSPAVMTCLYRVAQEALNNVARHSRATMVQVQLAEAVDGGLVLRISDNGKGLSADDRHKLHSFGLLGMHERVRAVGGELRINSQPDAGTTLDVAVKAADFWSAPAR
jgi:PAS domain S-box-containing protein